MNFAVENNVLLNSYKPEECNLFNLLLKQIPTTTLKAAFEQYAIGTAKTGDAIYWQINKNWNVKNAKINDKNVFDVNTYPPGMFGEHQLNEAGNKTTVYLLPTEFECLLMTAFYPNNSKGVRFLYMSPQSPANINAFKAFAPGAAAPVRRIMSLMGNKSGYNAALENVRKTGIEVINVNYPEIKIEQTLLNNAKDFEFEQPMPDFTAFVKERKIRRFPAFISVMGAMYQNEIIMQLAAAISATGANLGEEVIW